MIFYQTFPNKKFLFINETSISVEINCEIKALLAMALTNNTANFKSAMNDNDVDSVTVDAVLQSVASCDHLVSGTFELFSTAKRIEKYMTENFNYIEPARVPLGNGEFQYVSIIDTLKKITADRSFQKLRKVYKVSRTDEDKELDFCLSDLEDGVQLRNSPYFRSHPDALR